MVTAGVELATETAAAGVEEMGTPTDGTDEGGNEVICERKGLLAREEVAWKINKCLFNHM